MPSFNCKKCAVDRYHKVITHLTSTSAKVQCEVCGSKKTYKLSSAVKKKSGVTRAPSQKKQDAALASHRSEYETLVAKVSSDPVPYKMSFKFSANQKVEHPKFGLGVVRSTQSDKIEVLFPDEIRLLVHNRV